jgi:polysaccharide export outer membrane protein
MTAKFRSKNIADAARASRRDARLTRAPEAAFVALAAVLLLSAVPHAQGRAPAPSAPAPTAAPAPAATSPARPPAPAAPPPAVAAAAAAGVTPPPDYLIGADDVLSVIYWKDDTMTRDVVVRPDGRISLPLLNDVQASGLTVTQLGAKLTEDSKKFIEDPNVTIVVKQINSRRVSITGEVAKPGVYQLSGTTTVLDLISLAGGLRDYADSKHIVIIRTENGKAISHTFNYKDIASGKNLRQNLELKPADMIVVP